MAQKIEVEVEVVNDGRRLDVRIKEDSQPVKLQAGLAHVIIQQFESGFYFYAETQERVTFYEADGLIEITLKNATQLRFLNFANSTSKDTGAVLQTHWHCFQNNALFPFVLDVFVLQFVPLPAGKLTAPASQPAVVPVVFKRGL